VRPRFPGQAQRVTLPKPFSGSGMSSYVSGAQLALDRGMTANNFHKQGQCQLMEWSGRAPALPV